MKDLLLKIWAAVSIPVGSIKLFVLSGKTLIEAHKIDGTTVSPTPFHFSAKSLYYNYFSSDYDKNKKQE